MRAIWLVGYVAIALASSSAQAEGLVRWVTTFNASGFEPYAFDNHQTGAVQEQVYEGLICYDWQMAAQPCLALSWKQLDRLNWEWKLRQDVTFHDGSRVTSADVLFSLERAWAETSVKAFALAEIHKAVAKDDFTVLITTKGPAPALWDQLSMVPIMSKAWALAHGAERPAGVEALATSYANTHANGTGPFMLESFEPGQRIVLVRNPSWWGRDSQPSPGVDRIEQVQVATQDAGIDMLLRGEADFTQEIPAARLDEIRRTAGIRVKEVEAPQVLYLGFDLASSELQTSDVHGRNPFQDRRVREAVFRGIDFEKIRAAAAGLARPANLIFGRTAVGYDEELDQPLPFEPARARALLAEAGYPDGFSVALDVSRFHLPVWQALPSILAEIGIKVQLRVHATNELEDMIRSHQTDFYRWGYSEPLDSVYALTERYATGADYNTGYSNPEVDQLIKAIETEVSTYPRLGLMDQAWRRVLDDIVYVPLYRVVTAWAMRDRLDIPLGTNSNRPSFKMATVKAGTK